MTQKSFEFGSSKEEQGSGPGTPPPPDQEVRDRILDDLDSVLIVEASAGTGKTQILVDRMINVVDRGLGDVGGICAITYTRKAATELRERFQNGLEQRARDATDPVRKERLEAALRNLDSAFIGTVHAFCARMLRERPVEAGTPPGFNELEQAEADQLNLRVWEEYVESAGLDDENDLLRTLESLGVTADDLQFLFTWYCGNLDVDLAWSESAKPSMRKYWSRARKYVDALVPDLVESVSGYEPPWEALHAARRMFERIDDPSDLDVVELLARLERLDLKGRQLREGIAPKAVRETRQALEGVAAEGLRLWREYVHQFAIRFVRPAALEAARRRKESGNLMFSDLLVLSRDMLRDFPGIRRYFQNRYKRFFIDEFQDTDPVQTEIVFFLAGDEVESKSWRDQRPRPGSLFIVGDPKQSIYRFRRADITTYQQVRNLVEEAGGRLERLTTNFRSLPAICHWVNDRFETILVGGEEQAEYSPVEAYRGGDEISLYRRDWSSSDERDGHPGMTLAAAIADAVRTGTPDFGLGRALRWSDFLILTRERHRIVELAMDLEREGVPYEVTGAKKLGFEEILTDLMPLLKSIADPDDEVAFVGFLRGPWCGASDDDLYRYARAGGRWRVGKLPDTTPETIRRGVEFLEDAREEAMTLPPAAAFARLVDRLLLIPMELAGPQGRVRSGSLFLLTAIARARSAREGLRFEEIVDGFEQLLDYPGDREPLILESGDDDRVRLMNLHQAKGLEGNVVILTDPKTPKTRHPWSHVAREEEPPVAEVVVNRPGSGWSMKRVAQPVGWEESEKSESAFEAGQEDRLLYVAATRARDSLLVDFLRKSSGAERIGGPWKKLAGEDLVPLEYTPGEDRLESVRDEEESVVEDFEEIEQVRLSAHRRAAEPSFSVKTVTGLHHRSVRGVEGGGMGEGWGRAMHSVLESLMLDPETDVDILVANALRFEGVPDELEGDGVDLIRSVVTSPTWEAAVAADEKMVEVPIGFVENETRIRGVIDLVFRDDGGWVVIDYKSDIRGDRTDELVQAYTPQVQRYVDEWRRLTGEPTRGVLFFLDGCTAVEIE